MQVLVALLIQWRRCKIFLYKDLYKDLCPESPFEGNRQERPYANACPPYTHTTSIDVPLLTPFFIMRRVPSPSDIREVRASWLFRARWQTWWTIFQRLVLCCNISHLKANLKAYFKADFTAQLKVKPSRHAYVPPPQYACSADVCLPSFPLCRSLCVLNQLCHFLHRHI